MRLGIGQFNEAKSEFLTFAQQVGAEGVLLNSANLPSVDGTWALKDLVKLRVDVEKYNLELFALENVPIAFYDQIIFGGSERDRQIENMIATITNIARAGIPKFGYHWMPSHVWRTHMVTLAGGTTATAFDYDKAKKFPETHDCEYTEDDLWRNLEEWIKVITPVAEKEGIRLGIHPNDPPVEILGGIPQLFRSFESYKRLLSIVDSPANNIEFCQGTFAEMEDAKDEGIYRMIEYFSSRGKILYVHFRNVSSTVPVFHEEYIDTGYVDMRRAMKIYADNGYDGYFIDDHVPVSSNDSAWGHRGRSYATGYLKALIAGVTNTVAQILPNA